MNALLQIFLWPFVILNSSFALRNCLLHVFSYWNNHPFQLFADLLATHSYSGLLTAFYIVTLRMRCVVVTNDTSLKLQGAWRRRSTHYRPRPQDDRMFVWLKGLGYGGEGWTHCSCRMLNVVLQSGSLPLFWQLSERFWLTTATKTWKKKTGIWRAKFNSYVLLQASDAL
jgi:hypothetical protein